MNLFEASHGQGIELKNRCHYDAPRLLLLHRGKEINKERSILSDHERSPHVLIEKDPPLSYTRRHAFDKVLPPL